LIASAAGAQHHYGVALLDALLVARCGARHSRRRFRNTHPGRRPSTGPAAPLRTVATGYPWLQCARVKPAATGGLLGIMIRTRLVTRNIGTKPTRTSMRLEPELWDALREICLREDASLAEIATRAVRANPGGGRTSAVRVLAIGYFRDAAAMSGTRRKL
jgi:predicted DNA-binding ribbon-helix-helix protein